MKTPDNDTENTETADPDTQFFMLLVGAGLGMIFVGVFILMPLGF